jgi:hypothetical protein
VKVQFSLLLLTVFVIGCSGSSDGKDGRSSGDGSNDGMNFADGDDPGGTTFAHAASVALQATRGEWAADAGFLWFFAYGSGPDGSVDELTAEGAFASSSKPGVYWQFRGGVGSEGEWADQESVVVTEWSVDSPEALTVVGIEPTNGGTWYLIMPAFGYRNCYSDCEGSGRGVPSDISDSAAVLRLDDEAGGDVAYDLDAVSGELLSTHTD